MRARTLSWGLIALVVVLVAGASRALAFRASHVCELENGRKVRVDLPGGCRALAAPTPAATASPKPTRVPLPCEPFDTSVVKDFEEGQERMLCFDVKGPGPSIVAVGSQNRGNTQCAQMQTTMIGPSGQTYDSMGAQPGGTLFREEGRFYFWVKLIWGNPGPCRSYVFTVTK